MTKAELRSMISEMLKEELQTKKLSEATEPNTKFTTLTDAEFKKEFISFLIKKQPENKAAYEILNKLDFRSWSGTNEDLVLDIQNGIFSFPQFFVREKDYSGCAKYLHRYLSQVIKAAEKLTKLYDSLTFI